MTDPGFSGQHAADFDASASPGEIAAAHPCPKCHFELARLPVAARYCPRCGWDVSSGATPTVVSEFGGAWNSATLSDRPNSGEAAPAMTVLPLETGPAPAGFRSSILRGFASALYRLGTRYEGRLGAGQNLDEARRCFYKAARLGNTAAIARLSGIDPTEDRMLPPDE